MTRILLLRRDNIGDLVCTTPLIAALRERFPAAEIHALVNSYTLPVLENHPLLNGVHAYTKAKHRAAGESALGTYLRRIALLLRLRKMRFDYAILAAPGYQPRLLSLARRIRPRHILGFATPESRANGMDIPVPYAPSALHEAEDVFQLLRPLGIEGPPPAASIYPAPAAVAEARRQILPPPPAPLVGVHISARKPSQRWPAERFAELMRRLHDRLQAHFVLLWSPGRDDNPLHPGDDAKAAHIRALLPEGFPLHAYPTQRLQELIAALSLCDAVICSDGGAMHLAAALGKPIECFFGKSDAVRWRPWGVPYRLLQPASLEVDAISVEEAEAAFLELLKGL